MRFRLLLLFLPVLLGACSKTATPVQLDFIGTTTLTSGNKVVNPTDTLTTRAYAVGNDNLLKRLRIAVTYKPGPEPILYPVPISGYDPKTGPPEKEIVYLDSLLNPIVGSNNDSPKGGEFLFENRFSARSTSGTELWQYTATDVAGETASRAYRLTVRKTDSAAVYHNYTTVLRPVPRTDTTRAARSTRARSRVFLNLRYGLLLPKYALLNQENSLQSNQPLIDLIALSSDGTTVSLSAPADTRVLVLNAASWPVANRRATELRATRLTLAEFSTATTAAAFNAAFTNGTAFSDPLTTGTLTKNQVIAFRVAEGTATHTGLLLVSDVVLGTAPALSCSVKVQK
ncbi:hypothetical protein Q3A66_01270 [Hymenobacter sp. BT770]|uniref:hypothetical protein n=1 Tax=Hymenobacter sp. BT770 TaxID=2886942 RepID=UPI001D11E3FF|nr:hypothetical protein [Hymenobacter sp. BT770]MCC3153718.1 hypothetical protein [Hymenobacter sp. BT770]MDO3413681.1 hypothetical protein [Hymenobacter sp. BT770]